MQFKNRWRTFLFYGPKKKTQRLVVEFSVKAVFVLKYWLWVRTRHGQFKFRFLERLWRFSRQNFGILDLVKRTFLNKILCAEILLVRRERLSQPISKSKLFLGGTLSKISVELIPINRKLKLALICSDIFFARVISPRLGGEFLRFHLLN